jgi:hypothetical protein
MSFAGGGQGRIAESESRFAVSNERLAERVVLGAARSEEV